MLITEVVNAAHLRAVAVIGNPVGSTTAPDATNHVSGAQLNNASTEIGSRSWTLKSEQIGT